MSVPAAISGSFADYRLVKSRSVLQLVIEVPVEQQADVFAALGYPMPGEEIHVAVARLVSAASGELPERPTVKDAPIIQPPDGGASHLQYQRYAAASPAEQAVTRAALLPRDERFRAWVASRYDFPVTAGEMVSAVQAACFIRDKCCGGNSRKLIAETPEYLDRFLALETSFRMDVGEIARPR